MVAGVHLFAGIVTRVASGDGNELMGTVFIGRVSVAFLVRFPSRSLVPSGVVSRGLRILVIGPGGLVVPRLVIRGGSISVVTIFVVGGVSVMASHRNGVIGSGRGLRHPVPGRIGGVSNLMAKAVVSGSISTSSMVGNPSSIDGSNPPRAIRVRNISGTMVGINAICLRDGGSSVPGVVGGVHGSPSVCRTRGIVLLAVSYAISALVPHDMVSVVSVFGVGCDG